MTNGSGEATDGRPVDERKLDREVDVAVIGSGIGGLCTAALLAKNGHSVVVCESHTTPGGAAHGFERDGFHFESGPSFYTGFSVEQSNNPMRHWCSTRSANPSRRLPYDHWNFHFPDGLFVSTTDEKRFHAELAKFASARRHAGVVPARRAHEAAARAGGSQQAVLVHSSTRRSATRSCAAVRLRRVRPERHGCRRNAARRDALHVLRALPSVGRLPDRRQSGDRIGADSRAREVRRQADPRRARRFGDRRRRARGRASSCVAAARIRARRGVVSNASVWDTVKARAGGRATRGLLPRIAPKHRNARASSTSIWASTRRGCPKTSRSTTSCCGPGTSPAPRTCATSASRRRSTRASHPPATTWCTPTRPATSPTRYGRACTTSRTSTRR